MLLDKGYDVAHLSRSKKASDKIRTFVWNIEKKEMEKEASDYFDNIIHLAGANVAEKKWTSKRKKEIVESRTRSAELLIDSVKASKCIPQVFISASGIDFYPNDRGEKEMEESDAPGDSFLSIVTQKWEESVDPIKNSGVRLVKFRTGIVLSDKGGALPKLAQPVKLGAGSPLGSGKQYMSWIHIDDLCNLMIFALENKHMSGTYNAVSSYPVTNKEFVRAVARQLNMPVILPNVPAFVLKMVLGEMSEMILGGIKVSNRKVLNEGFRFEYEKLEDALKSLLK